MNPLKYQNWTYRPCSRPARAELERAGRLRAVITQNIDGLHQAAGSREVLELHGSVHRNYCTRCGREFDARYVKKAEGVPVCDACGGMLKPDVVLYEEALDSDLMYRAVDYIRRAEVLIIGGTSLVVYPAAGLVNYYQGDKLVLINKSPTAMDMRADLVISGPIGEVLGQIQVYSPGKQRVTLEYGQAVPYALTDTAFLGSFQSRFDFLNALGWLHGVHGVF